MSRSGYLDYCDDTLALGRWRAQVLSATRGKRGQALFKDLAAAMDAMPVKRLISEALECKGEHCALGVVGAKRGVDMEHIDPEDSEVVAANFDIASQLACEIVFQNDENGPWGGETPEERWTRIRAWVQEQIK